MSKIYEALLQAHRERHGTAPKRKGAGQTSQAVEEVREGEEFPSAVRIVGERSTRSWIEDAPEVIKERGRVEPLEGIAEQEWKLDISKLPALEARGGNAEQFRSLRSRLYEYRSLNALKTVLISSGVPQEGKSFVAANLAVSLARFKGSKILLIDADLRRHTLDRLLGAPPMPGLASYLTGEATAQEVMQRAALSGDADVSGIANLTFIPGGRGGDLAADLSGSKRFRDLITFAEPYFDWIIVDSSPVTLVSDAVNLASSSDGVLLVVRSGVTKYEIAQRAQKEFSSANVIGVVLNGVDENGAANSYYGYDSETETNS